ncbi:unnamed protein product [Closterium sp. NIES-65]|nr:unnamed protein product [Closterium sp. NIES-65]
MAARCFITSCYSMLKPLVHAPLPIHHHYPLRPLPFLLHFPSPSFAPWFPPSSPSHSPFLSEKKQLSAGLQAAFVLGGRGMGQWYAWWIKDDCSSQALWNSVQASSDVRSSVLAVWGPGTAGASTSFQDYVLMAANNRRNPSCVKTYLLDWIKCKAAPTDSAVQFYNSALGVGVSGVKDVRSLNTFVTAVIKKIGQTVFNTLAGMLRQRGLQAQVVMAGTWC